jgi:hypothetical protein
LRRIGRKMAGKPRNRLELRRQYEAAEPPDPMEAEQEDSGEIGDDGDEEVARPRRKPKAAPRKSKATKAAKPAVRMRVVWQVVNDAFKPVASFEFSQQKAAEARAAELTAKGKGTHFIQKVKEAMPDDAPGLGATIPRAELEPATKKKRVTKKAEIEEELEDELEAELDEDDVEDEEEEEEDDDEE